LPLQKLGIFLLYPFHYFKSTKLSCGLSFFFLQAKNHGYKANSIKHYEAACSSISRAHRQTINAIRYLASFCIKNMWNVLVQTPSSKRCYIYIYIKKSNKLKDGGEFTVYSHLIQLMYCDY